LACVRTSLLPEPPASGDIGDLAQNEPVATGEETADAVDTDAGAVVDDCDDGSTSVGEAGLTKLGVVGDRVVEVSTGVGTCDSMEDCDGC